MSETGLGVAEIGSKWLLIFNAAAAVATAAASLFGKAFRRQGLLDHPSTDDEF